MIKAVFPGSFDPPTYGHLDIIRRSSRLFNSLDVLIAVNPRKKSLMHAREKLSLLKGEIEDMHLHKVDCLCYEGLVVDYCRSAGAGLIVRGVRNSADFDYELELASINSQIGGGVETVLIPANPGLANLRSSSARELLYFGGDISKIVPPSVAIVLMRNHRNDS